MPERLGGDGVGLSELATALTEIGRHGTIGPALAVLGATVVLLDLASDAQQDRYLAGLAKGSVADARPSTSPAPPLPERPAVTLADGRLNGTKIARSLCGASGLDRS